MRDDDLEDLGSPVTELRELEEPTQPGFLRGVRNRIERRAFAGSVLDLSIPMLGEVVREYLSMVFSIFGGEKKAQKREDETNE